MNKIKSGRAAGFAVIILVYIIVSAAGIKLYAALGGPLWQRLLISDAAATVLTFVFSLLFGNASVYDPYWSVAPIVILTGLAAANGNIPGIGSATAPLLISVWLWGTRLTANWAYTFKGLGRQDWRYTMLKEKTGVFYPVINLLGIHMFPTLIVYLCVLPAAYAVESGARAVPVSYIGMAVCVFAALLQLVSDAQMHAFRKRGTGGLMRGGLWKYSRHPNYLGEILMWWGVALQAACALPGRPLFFAGAAANTAMFLFISIPMADKRQAEKPGYEEYRAATRSLLPLKKKLPEKRAECAGADGK